MNARGVAFRFVGEAAAVWPHRSEVGSGMPHIPYPSNQNDISTEAKAILDTWEKAYGRPSHIFRALSWNARFLKSAWESWNWLVVEPKRLERWVREACVVITCSTQQTEYCVQGHSHSLRREGRHLTEDQVKAIQNRTFEGFSDPLLSIFRFVHKAAGIPKASRPEDYPASARSASTTRPFSKSWAASGPTRR